MKTHWTKDKTLVRENGMTVGNIGHHKDERDYHGYLWIGRNGRSLVAKGNNLREVKRKVKAAYEQVLEILNKIKEENDLGS